MHSTRTCSRRAWLRDAGCAASSLVLWPACLSAALSARERLRFCVISDTHLGYRDQDAAERQWRATAAELARADGEFVLHLGDVVDGERVTKRLPESCCATGFAYRAAVPRRGSRSGADRSQRGQATRALSSWIASVVSTAEIERHMTYGGEAVPDVICKGTNILASLDEVLSLPVDTAIVSANQTLT